MIIDILFFALLLILGIAMQFFRGKKIRASGLIVIVLSIYLITMEITGSKI